MNRLNSSIRCPVIAMLCEGDSINATCRMTGGAKDTVLKLLKDLDCAAASNRIQLTTDGVLRVTPAMESGLTDHVWSLEELISLCEEKAKKM